ncbi:MAG: hypothetical protein ACI4F8_10990 [Lachnospiraceae bacterium]
MPVAEKTEHRDAEEKIIEIELERLRSFANHSFKVQADSQMIKLQDSIRKYDAIKRKTGRRKCGQVDIFEIIR